jgi:ferredoxin
VLSTPVSGVLPVDGLTKASPFVPTILRRCDDDVVKGRRSEDVATGARQPGQVTERPWPGPIIDICARRPVAWVDNERETADKKGKSQRMKVWIDQDLCTGDGLCEEIAPAVFTLLDDGLSYVKEGNRILNEPGGHAGLALVPEDMEDATRESAEECPGECIFIEE